MNRNRKSSRYITRKAFNRFAILVFVIVLSATSGAMLHANAMDGSAKHTAEAYDAPQQEFKKLCVESGDSLWSIAKKYKEPGSDIRSYVHEIKIVNRLDSSELEVGQVLLLP